MTMLIRYLPGRVGDKLFQLGPKTYSLGDFFLRLNKWIKKTNLGFFWTHLKNFPPLSSSTEFATVLKSDMYSYQ